MKIKRILKDNERILIVFLVVAVALTVITAAQNVSGFDLYEPFDNLMFSWNDPNMDRDYPYRAMFLIGTNRGGANYSGSMLFLYSKKPTTDIFTFRYSEAARLGGTGYIEAYFNWREMATDTDEQALRMYLISAGDLDGTENATIPDIKSTGGNVKYYVKDSGFYFDDNNAYFEFDFYYDCAEEHGGGIRDLSVSGLGSVANVPYDYIIACKRHESLAGGGSGKRPPTGGGQTGGGNGGGSGVGDGGTSGGGGYGGGRDGNEPPPSNGNGDGGRHGWGSGFWGGGVDRDYIDNPFEGEELDWREPWNDNYNQMPEEYKPYIPPYTLGAGDTGEDGSDWELPVLNPDDHGVTGEPEGYEEFAADGEYGLIDFMEPYYWERR